MKKEQLVLIAGGLALLLLLYFFGNTVPPRKKEAAQVQSATQSIDITAIINSSREKLPAHQQKYLKEILDSAESTTQKEAQIHYYHRLAGFWSDSTRSFLPYAYYISKAAKLENSEKNLTFAAQLLLDNLRGVDQPAIKSWLAGEAKGLFEKAILLNPGNDSLKIGLGSTYIFGASAENPQEVMQGIQRILEVSRRDSSNLYAQKMLGIGGILSGQYDKGVERLEKVAHEDPQDLESMLLLGEGYERLGNKAKAIEWYQRSAKQVENQELKTEINRRIQQLR